MGKDYFTLYTREFYHFQCNNKRPSRGIVGKLLTEEEFLSWKLQLSGPQPKVSPQAPNRKQLKPYRSLSLSLLSLTANERANLAPPLSPSHPWSSPPKLRHRRRFHRRLLQAFRHHHTWLCFHSAPCLVHPRLSLLSSRFQPSRFGLARHHQGMLLHALSIFVFDSCFLIVISLFCTDFNFLRFLVFLFTNWD